MPVETDNGRPRVTVLMSVYNAEKYLAAAVESILNQTFRDFEIIIVDDGSTDSSLSILREYERRDSRIRLVSRPNTGLVGALNEALGMADSDLIARMDADDISLPERFARQVEFLGKHLDHVAVGCHSLWVDPAGLPLKVMPQRLTYEEIDAELLRGHGNAITHAASMYRRSELLTIGGYRTQFESAEDVDLFLRLAERGKLANLADVLYVYRQHPASVNHTQGKKQDAATRNAVDAARRRRKLPESDQYVGAGSRPTNKATLYLRWSTFAMEGGNLRTARKYVCRLALLRPLSRDTWRRLAKCYLPAPVWRAWCEFRHTGRMMPKS